MTRMLGLSAANEGFNTETKRTQRRNGRRDCRMGRVLNRAREAGSRRVGAIGGDYLRPEGRRRVGSLCLAPDFLRTWMALFWSATLKMPVVRPPGAPLVT